MIQEHQAQTIKLQEVERRLFHYCWLRVGLVMSCLKPLCRMQSQLSQNS